MRNKGCTFWTFHTDFDIIYTILSVIRYRRRNHVGCCVLEVANHRSYVVAQTCLIQETTGKFGRFVASQIRYTCQECICASFRKGVAWSIAQLTGTSIVCVESISNAFLNGSSIKAELNASFVDTVSINYCQINGWLCFTNNVAICGNGVSNQWWNSISIDFYSCRGTTVACGICGSTTDSISPFTR